jgi:hypothetical protein
VLPMLLDTLVTYDPGCSLDDLVYWLTIKERSTVTSPGW